MKKPKPERDCLELCTLAAEILKRAGFRHVYTSMKTESCYYEFAGRPMLLRVSTHPTKEGPPGMKSLAAKITFGADIISRPGHMRIGDDKVEQIVAAAIGRYLLHPENGPVDRQCTSGTLPP